MEHRYIYLKVDGCLYIRIRYSVDVLYNTAFPPSGFRNYKFIENGHRGLICLHLHNSHLKINVVNISYLKTDTLLLNMSLHIDLKIFS